MEYQFTHTIHGVIAKCSMDHEAFAHWFNIELRQDPTAVQELLAEIAKCKGSAHYEAIFEGREYSLYLSAEEVMAKANHLEMEWETLEQIEDGLSFYDEESIAFCGLEDFEAFLHAYLRFARTYH